MVLSAGLLPGWEGSGSASRLLLEKQPLCPAMHHSSASHLRRSSPKTILVSPTKGVNCLLSPTNAKTIMKAFICVLAMAVASGMAQKVSQPDACQAKSKIVADVQYCDRYWECLDGKAEQFDCPNGLVFAGKGRGLLENCNYPWAVSDSCDDKQLANPPRGTGVCDWHYGIFGHESSCIRYWTCWNNTATEQFCIGGLLYNEDKHACDWPEAVEGCQKHPLCKDDPNGNVPLGKSCNRYWACQGGYPRLQRCPATLVFDKSSLRCVNPPTADCEAPPPPPPEDDEKTGSSRQQADDDDDEEVPPPRASSNRS